jgi:hypothetical protein
MRSSLHTAVGVRLPDTHLLRSPLLLRLLPSLTSSRASRPMFFLARAVQRVVLPRPRARARVQGHHSRTDARHSLQPRRSELSLPTLRPTPLDSHPRLPPLSSRPLTSAIRSHPQSCRPFSTSNQRHRPPCPNLPLLALFLHCSIQPVSFPPSHSTPLPHPPTHPCSPHSHHHHNTLTLTITHPLRSRQGDGGDGFTIKQVGQRWSVTTIVGARAIDLVDITTHVNARGEAFLHTPACRVHAPMNTTCHDARACANTRRRAHTRTHTHTYAHAHTHTHTPGHTHTRVFVCNTHVTNFTPLVGTIHTRAHTRTYARTRTKVWLAISPQGQQRTARRPRRCGSPSTASRRLARRRLSPLTSPSVKWHPSARAFPSSLATSPTASLRRLEAFVLRRRTGSRPRPSSLERCRPRASST